MNWLTSVHRTVFVSSLVVFAATAMGCATAPVPTKPNKVKVSDMSADWPPHQSAGKTKHPRLGETKAQTSKRYCSSSAVNVGIFSGLGAYGAFLIWGTLRSNSLSSAPIYFLATLIYGAPLPIIGGVVGCGVGTVRPDDPDPLDRIDWNDKTRSYRWKP
mgnify:CR=1 FL=1